MTDYEELFEQTVRDLKQRDELVADLERAVADHLHDLAIATDTAVQRGKRIDAVQAVVNAIPGIATFIVDDIQAALDGG